MKISRLCLGTAQLGMDYGINNRTGRPGPEESRAIVRTAVAAGITAFDTAPAYGDSERVLGRCLAEWPGERVIVSKVPPIDWTPGPEAAALAIRRGIESSLRNLGVPRLGICLFHRFEDLMAQDGAALAALDAISDEGLIGKIGCSIYTPGQAEACLRLSGCEVIQAPFNLADKRLLDVDLFRRAKAAGKFIFARSVYLQGLFFSRELPAGLDGFAPFREKLQALASAAGLDLAEIALRFALSIEGIDSVIVGVETAAQLEKNLDLAARGALPGTLTAEIKALGTASAPIIDPRQWPR